MGINADIQRLEPGKNVKLYELDAVDIGGELLLFHGHTQAGSIWWQGREFKPWAIEVEGMGRTGEGAQPTPTLSVSNIGPDENGEMRAGVIGSLCLYLQDMVGAKLTVHETLGKYLDARNFPGGNPSANPNEHMPLEVWLVEMKTEDTLEVVSLMLSSALDFDGVQLPRGQVIAGTCRWLITGNAQNRGYRGPYCGYIGEFYFDRNDSPVQDPALDKCGGRLNSCQIRFGAQQRVIPIAAVVNFGGFPSADRVRA